MTMLLFGSSTLTAQTYQWAKSYGGIYNDNPDGIATDGAGNFYIGGDYYPSIDFGNHTVTATNTLGGDIFLAKIDANGDPLWATSSASDSLIVGLAGVAADATGNVYAAGSFTGNFTWGGKTITNTNKTSLWLAKFNPQGNIIWLRKAGFSNNIFRLRDISVSPSGTVFLGGDFWGGATLGTQPLSVGNVTTGFAAQFDSSGAFAWADAYGQPSSSISIFDIFTDDQENLYLTGSLSGAITFDQHTVDTAGGSIFAVKLDGSGSSQWGTSLGINEGAEEGKAIVTDPNGNAYVGGYITKANSFSPSSIVAKLNPSGQVVWNKEFPADSKTEVLDLAVNQEGHVFLTGPFSGSQMYLHPITLANQGSVPDVFVAELDSSGAPLWAEAIGSAQADEPAGMVLQSGNIITIFGSYGFQFSGGPQNPTLTVENTTLTSVGKQDMFLVQMEGTTTGPGKVLTLTAPTGTETWYVDSTYTISWTSSNVSEVDIQYSFDFTATWEDAQTNIDASLGTVSWQVPETTSASAWIRILDADDHQVGDTTGSAITIARVTGLQETAEQEAEVKVTPNPFTESFHLHFDAAKENTVVKLFDATGKEVKNINVNLPAATVSTPGLPAGVYYLHIYQNDQLVGHQKLVKQ